MWSGTQNQGKRGNFKQAVTARQEQTHLALNCNCSAPVGWRQINRRHGKTSENNLSNWIGVDRNGILSWTSVTFHLILSSFLNPKLPWPLLFKKKYLANKIRIPSRGQAPSCVLLAVSIVTRLECSEYCGEAVQVCRQHTAYHLERPEASASALPCLLIVLVTCETLWTAHTKNTITTNSAKPTWELIVNN